MAHMPEKEQTWDGSRIFVRLNTEPSVGLYDMDASSLKDEKTARPVPPRRETAAPPVAWSVAYGLAGTRARMDAVIDGDLAVDEHVI